MTRRPRSSFEYDIALSFAGEQRPLAAELADLLKAAGLSVFYDLHRKSHLWGKDEREIERVYGPASRFVAPFISKDYAAKHWPRFEFDTALREERKRQQESILPIRVDQSRLVGLHDARFYLSLEENNLADIAACIVEKCREAAIKETRQRDRSSSARSGMKVTILTDEGKAALGIIVASRIPLPLELFQGLFPEIDWSAHCRMFAKCGLVLRTGSMVKPSARALRAIQVDGSLQEACSDRWVKKLEELKDHQDIALYLATYYMGEGRTDDAIHLLAEIANTGLYGHWNETFLDCLEKLNTDRIVRKLKPETRMLLFHALAICSTQAKEYEKAFAWFEKVRKESLKAKDQHWLGQYYINSGVAHNLSGDRQAAADAFQKAVGHGEDHDDPFLVGRSLANLAQLRMTEDEPDAAIDLLQKSIAWKKKARDEYGMALASAQLGTIEANRSNLERALEHFVKAERLCDELGLTYERARITHSIGSVYFDLGQPGKALNNYKRACRLASDSDYIDVQLMAIQGVARACHALKRFDVMEREFRSLLDSPISATYEESRLSAYHGIGVAQAAQGRADEAKQNLRRALKLARKLKDADRTARILAALGGFSDDKPFGDPAPERLARLSSHEEKQSNWLVASKLWDLSARIYIRSGNIDEADGALLSAARCLEKAGGKEHEFIETYFKLFAWRWQSGRFEVALDALNRAEQIAATCKFKVARAKAIDERGLALQRLGRSKEALPLHMRAAELSRKHGLLTQLRISLNNLGQAFRRLGQHDEAIAPLEESEKQARTAEAYGDALGTMVNRGIVLDEGGHHNAAGTVLRKCSDEAKRRSLWREYVMALEALGNLAWHRGRLRQAEEYYRQGHAVAKRRSLKESEAELAVNYASLLGKLGKPKQALKFLQGYESDFSTMMDAHICHDVLAGLYMANGDRESAKRNWEEGRTFAQTVGCVDYIAVCSASLAQVYEGEGQVNAAERELEVALGYEPDVCSRWHLERSPLQAVKRLLDRPDPDLRLFLVLRSQGVGVALSPVIEGDVPPVAILALHSPQKTSHGRSPITRRDHEFPCKVIQILTDIIPTQAPPKVQKKFNGDRREPLNSLAFGLKPL